MRRKSTFFYCLCLSFLLLSTTAFSQKNALKDADQDFKNMRYFDAIELYKKAYTDLGDKQGNGVKTQKAHILFQIAECYRMMGDAKQEEQWYKKAIKANYPDDNDILYLADAQRQQGNYDDALTNYKAYKEKVPSNKAADAGIESCQKATAWKTTPTRYEVTNMAQINAKNRDYSPCYADRRYDELYFVSTRPGSSGDPKLDPNLGEAFADIFDTKADKNGKWSAPVPLPAPINTPDNEGPMCFSHDYKTLYFTRCAVAKNKGVRCQIWYAERKGNTWGDPVMIPFQNDTTTYAYPTLTPDDQELIFSSDMAGGQGKMDLYVSHWDKKSKQWLTPANLTDLNTPGNDVFPFVHADGTLYFSTDGLPGMGGLDIFKASKVPNQTDKWNKPENMQYPINSEADDFGIIFEGSKERGYFTSNRAGGKGSDDIYSFNLPPLLFAASGTVRDKKTNKPIVGAIVQMVGSDGSIVAVKTDTGGHYFMGAKDAKERYMKPGNSYILSADGRELMYLASPVKANVSTVGVPDSKTYVNDFVLEKAVGALRFPKVEYALDLALLTENSKDSLNYLVKLLKDNPTIKIQLDAHTDPRGSLQHNLKLSQARAQSCVDYLISQGIDSARLTAKGWAQKVPLPGCSEADIAKMKNQADKELAWQADRRTEFRVLSFNYVPKGGLSHQDSLKMMMLKDAKISGQGAEIKDTAAGDQQAPQHGPNENTPNMPHGPMMPQSNEGVIYKKN
jgi:peptidoglycan-associated lipoprotein